MDDSYKTEEGRAMPRRGCFWICCGRRISFPRLIQVLKTEDLSPTQYNVLRILRGSPDGLPCGEIGSRMITRDPDITRLLDRLEKRGLIARYREEKDRRMVMARITPRAESTGRLDEPVRNPHRKQLGHLGRERLRTLASCSGRPGSELNFSPLIFVATNIVVTHLNKNERNNTMSTTVTEPQATTTWNIDPSHSVAEFKVKHMMISNVKGHFSEVSGR